jgi:hypothetical protein
MSLSYPLTLPTDKLPREIVIRARSVVGVSESPFNLAQQVQAMSGERWEADVMFPPIRTRALADDLIGFLTALNGQEGTFLMGDPVNTSPRGGWAGSPLVKGAHAARVKTVTIDGLTIGTTAKRGDWVQFGTGSGTHLHKVVQDGTANGSGEIALEIWPGLREALADNATITITSTKGLFRLASNVREYTVGLAQTYGIKFSCVEAL